MRGMLNTPQPFTKPYLLLVEGPTDAAFFRHLIRARNITDNFNVRSPRDADGVHSGGNTRFGEALDAFRVEPTFSMVTEIIVVSDNDDDPTDALTKIQAQIKSASHGYAVPKTPLVKTKGKVPHVTILMLPSTGVTGCLETLCLKAACNENPELAKCVAELGACTGAIGWSPSKRAKSDLRCLIASYYQRNPDESLSFLWDDIPSFIPLKDPVFDDIAVFLERF